jgi:hypothetical protein
MKNLFKAFLFVAFIGFLPAAVKSQVVMKEFLLQNHEGQVDNSANNNGKPLYYKFEYTTTDHARINYKLYLYKEAGKKNPWITFDVLMRNLTWTYYVDITFPKDNTDKVAAMIFKKDLRWSRVKFSPHEGCLRVNPPVWERMNMVDDYERLMQNFIMQIDKNVDLNCYSSATVSN